MTNFLVEIYCGRHETLNLDRAKTPRFNDRKRVHIVNIEPFTIVESREFSRGAKSKFHADRSITVGARSSRLSQAQVDEVSQFYPHIKFSPIWIDTQGDQDKTTSLKTLEKTNFFTDEIDRRQLNGEFRISIHSAKDLPDPLHPDLEIVAITKGVDPSDSLVVREFPIRYGSRIGTSSLRREAFLKKWRYDLECVDIRGTIDERLKLLDEGFVDGVVMAEAALIRLGLTDRPRLHLETDTAELQGRLAIIARKNDHSMKQLFKEINDDACNAPADDTALVDRNTVSQMEPTISR